MLLVEDRDRVRLLTFNRPDRANAFNEELYHAAADGLRAAAADDDVAVVVFTGAGKAFCAGTDLLEMAETVDHGVGAGVEAGVTGGTTSRSGFPAFVDVLQEVPKPLMAAVNGAAVGLGFTMLAHCDLVLVSDRARLLAPFTNMGVAPEAASSYLLPRRMGRQQASMSLFTSDWISAEDAVATGLAVQQCRPEALVDETMELATRIASKSLPSLMATKRLLLDAEREGIARARTLENQAFAELLALPNAKDGVLGQLD
jgi:enoyl-CoA hydratase/carnithine racemase